MPDQVAFVVMPFNRKQTGHTEMGVPTEVDFDALWENVYQPVLEKDLGYKAVRADRDVGALIISQMVQRLAVADLVVADITLANANVYYEIGVRHAAKARGCVLIAADWARPVFDLDQMRQLRFPLTDGNVTEKKAINAAAKALRKDLKALVDGVSPVFDAVPGFPQSDAAGIRAFADTVAELSRFEADVKAVRATPQQQRADRVSQLVKKYRARPAVRDVVALELVRLVRDHQGWQELLDYIDTLPKNLQRLPYVLEQQALALSGTGDIPGSVGRFEQLIADHGETADRLGMLGGRYKRLARTADTPGEGRRYLDLAIGAYQRGMDVDLNDFYPASNLAQLYRERGAAGDERRAMEADVVTAVACRAAIANGTMNEWVRPTLLVNAFHRGAVAEAIELRQAVENDGLAAWKVDSVIDDLRAGVASQDHPDVKASLAAVLEQLEALR